MNTELYDIETLEQIKKSIPEKYITFGINENSISTFKKIIKIKNEYNLYIDVFLWDQETKRFFITSTVHDISEIEHYFN